MKRIKVVIVTIIGDENFVHEQTVTGDLADVLVNTYKGDRQRLPARLVRLAEASASYLRQISSPEDSVPDKTSQDPKTTEFEMLCSKQVEELHIQVRTYNSLHNGGIRTIDDILKLSDVELLRIKNFGRKSFDDLDRALLSIHPSLKIRETRKRRQPQE